MGVDAAGNQLGLVALSKETGDLMSEVTWAVASSPSFLGIGHVFARGDDTMLVERTSSLGFAYSFDGVSRIDANGNVLWTFVNDDCAPSGGDSPSPHPFIRIGEDMLIVCESGPRLIDANGKTVRDTPLALMPEPRSTALRPDGHVVYVAHDDTGASKVIDLDTSGIPHATEFDTFFGWNAAMAADGTFLFIAYDHPLTSLYLVAFATDHVSWSVPLGYPTDSFAPDLMVDEGHTVVVATRTTIAAFDSMSGIKLWEVPIADSDAGVASPSLAAAGPHALYVLRDRTLFRLSDF